MIKRTLNLILGLSFFSLFSAGFLNATPIQSLKITEVMAGSASSSSEEFIELINTSNSSVDVTGWKVKFISSSNVQKELATLDGVVAAGQIVTLANYEVGFTPSYSFTSAPLTYNGHLIILDAAGQEIDKLGWGTALSYEIQAIAAMAGGKIASRYIDCTSTIIDTDNNAEDFLISTTSNFGSVPVVLKAACAPPEEPKLCNNIELSEILPNAAGSDEDKEFIEIYNPLTEPISLYGCSLKTNASSKTYNFGKNDFIKPNEYVAIYDTQSGLSLLNAAGGRVTLITISAENVVEYPAGLSDDTSWSLVDGVWQQTNRPSPNASNIAYVEDSSTSIAENKGAIELASCPEGKYRNPATNRCKNYETESSVIDCPDGKYLNPATNRCKSIQLASSVLSPCKPGQYRNPETNRCKNTESNDELAPCDEGYERNPETNRCRKVSAVKASAAQVPQQATSEPVINYPIILIFALLTFGYGLYEYKSELKHFWHKIIKKK